MKQADKYMEIVKRIRRMLGLGDEFFNTNARESKRWMEYARLEDEAFTKYIDPEGRLKL